MHTKELLTAIWDLKKVHRPALIVEETMENFEIPKPVSSTNPFASLLNESLKDYHSLYKNKDDNIPTLNTSIGTYVIPSAFGGKERIFDDGHKYLDGPIIFKPSDVDRLKAPKAMQSLLGKQIELIAYYAEETKGEYPIRIGDVQNPLGVAEMMWETNDFYTSLIEAPEQVHKLLGMITEVVIEYVSRVKEVCSNLVPISWPIIWGPNEKGVYLADDTMSMISPPMYEEFGVTYNNVISKHFGGLMLHSCTMKEPYFKSIMKNEGLRSINFAAQYSSDMKKIFEFFGGKVVILPHYYHTDSPQIGTVTEFIDKVMDCWTPDTPAIIYVGRKQEGGLQQEIFDTFWKHCEEIK